MESSNGPPKPLLAHNVSINALMAVSPVIKEAINSSSFKDHLEHLDCVILPNGNVQAYKILLAGLRSAYDHVHLNTIGTQYVAPLYNYYYIMSIAKKLGIGHIAEQMQGAFDSLSRHTVGKPCIIDHNDIVCAYRYCPVGHVLREVVVEKIARGIADRQLFGRVAGKVYEAQEKFGEFYEDLEARKEELWAEGH